MHPNPVFREDDQARALVAARERGFGVLVVPGPEGVLASHIPFVLEATTLAAHMARNNPILPLLDNGPAEALVIVSGPDAYVSPDWYGEDDQVPTWNYVAVHLRGPLRRLPDAVLPAHLAALSAAHEAHLAKPPWTMDRMAPGKAGRMMRAIVPVEMAVASVEATFKLNQNKTDAARLSAAEAVERAGYGHEAQALAALMRLPKQH